MMNKLMMVSIASLLLCLGMQDPMASEKKAVERAMLDYVEGVYDVKPELIERSVHPNLEKIGWSLGRDGQTWREHPMTFEQLVNLAGEYNADGRVPDDAPRKIKVLDVLDKTASGKLVAHWGIDYFHLVKEDGKWKILQVMWQTHPRHD